MQLQNNKMEECAVVQCQKMRIKFLGIFQQIASYKFKHHSKKIIYKFLMTFED